MDTENCHVCNADTPYPSVSHESVPSLIDNLTYALYGIITKTVLNGRVQWTIPCDPNSTGSIWGYTRNAGEGLMCYMLRVLQSTAPGLPPIGVNGQVLVSLGGNAVEWRDSVVNQATTTLMGGFKLASTNSDVLISTASILALSTTGVAAGTFGSPTQFPILTVDSKGRITSASTQAIAIASDQISGISASQVGAGLTSAQISSISSAAIPASGVTAGTFGSSTQLPVLTVDSKGRITSATTIPHLVGNNASDLTTGTLNSARLPALTGDILLPAGTSVTALTTTGVSAGTFGSSTQMPVLTVDAKGRITSIATSQIAVNANNITSGTISALRLPAFTGDVLVAAGTSVAALQTTGVSAGTFGSSAQIPVLTVDTKGRITVAGSTPVLPGNNASDLTTGTLNPARLATSGVAAGSFGAATQIPVLTVDSKGRVTAASSVTVPAGDNASDLTTGTLDPNRLATSGVSAGTFGSSATVAQFTVDSKGRITNALEIGISGSAGGTVVSVGAESNTLVVSNNPVIYSGALQVELATTGVPAITAGSSTQSAVITVDTYGRITSLETQSIAALFPTGVTAGTYGTANKVGAFSVDVNGVMTGATEQVISIEASQVLAGITSAQISGISAAQVAAGITSAQINGLSASQVGNGITSAQVVGLSAQQISAGITSAQVTGLSASQIGTGLTSAQVIGLSAQQISAGITSAQVTGLSASQIGTGITSDQIVGLSASQIGVGITSAQVNGLSASQIGSGITSAQIVSLSAQQIGSGITSAQISGISAAQVAAGITSAQIGVLSSSQISGLSAGQIAGLSASATTDTTNAANISSGLLNLARLPFSGVVATNYGSATTVPVISVDAYGRITSATSASVTQLTNASQITSGTLDPARLATSGVSAGSFGNSTQIAALTVDQFGRITSASNIPASVTVTNFSLVRETVNISPNAAGVSGVQFDVLSQGVLYYTGVATGNWFFNVRGNSGTTLNSSMSVNQSITIVFLNTTGATAYGLASNASFTIDGTGNTANRSLRWLNTSAPSASTNGVDAWSFTIIKTADNVFTVLGNLSSWGSVVV